MPLVSFGGWAGLGALGWQLRIQGVQLIGNVFFGPTFNASLGIAQQVSGYAGTLPSTVISVCTPALTQLHGRKDLAKMRQVRDLASQACALLTLAFATPFLLESEWLLEMWLESPPSLATAFLAILLVNLAIDQLTTVYGILFTATGAIRPYSIFTFLNVIFQLILVWCLANGFPASPTIAVLVIIAGTLANLCFRVGYAEELELHPFAHWATKTLRCVLPQALVAMALAYSISIIDIRPSVRVPLVFLTNAFTLTVLVIRFSLSESQRSSFFAYGASAWNRMRKN